MSTIVGVDPGGRYVGVVRRNGDGVSAACVLTRTTGDDLPDQAFIHEVLDEIAVQLEDADAVAIEWLTMPRGHNPEGDQTYITVYGIVGTGMIIGAVLARWPDAIIVPAGGNGDLPEQAYPEPIRKRVRIGGPSTHARSAYDVARRGDLLLRINRGGTR